MKGILPSLKEKKRYLAYEVISEGNLNKYDIAKAVKENSLKFMGSLNYGKAGVKMISAGKKGIVKVNNKFVDHLKSSLILINKVGNNNVMFKTVKVSGVLKKLKEAM